MLRLLCCGLAAAAGVVVLTPAAAPADDDILSLASSLSSPPAELKKVLGQMVKRDEPKNALAGKRASGKLNIRDIFIEFGKDGETVSAYTSRVYTEKAYSGKYTVTGDKVEFTLGPSKFVGTISDGGVSGTRKRTDGVDDTWDVKFDN